MGLAQKVRDRDPMAVGRLLSLIENGDAAAAAEMRQIYGAGGDSYVIGVTGPPGSGKSSLTDRLIGLYRSAGKKVAVLAIDPSSPFSGGAVLGDRIRMQNHSTDVGVFIRSMANRNWPGGLSRCAGDAVRVMGAYGSDIVIVETVGVGQSEVDVKKLAYTTVLLCTPDAGDKVQAMKAGVIEIADIIALNKSDLPNAGHAARAIEMILSMQSREGWAVPLIKTTARDGEGVEELGAAIENHRRFIESRGILEKIKESHARDLLLDVIRDRIEETVSRYMPDERQIHSCMQRIMAGGSDPYSIADEYVKNLTSR